MSAKALRGKPLAEKLLVSIRERAAKIAQQRGSPPRLAILAIGGDSSSQVYLRSKLQACKEAGVETTVEALHAAVPESDVLAILKDLATDATLDGIMLEVPLPKGLDARRIIDAICPDRDVEGVTTANLGRLYSIKTFKELQSSGVLLPCTAGAAIRLLLETGLELAGKSAVVVGRSRIVGRPAAHLLSCLDATVTLCHSKTRELASHLSRADIVLSATGVPGLIRGSDLKPGAVILDAGIHVSGKTVQGDVDHAGAAQRASYLTPVPGGVGPLTVACLLDNVTLSAERRVKAQLG